MQDTRRGRQLQQLYGWTVPLSMVSKSGESGARDMRQPVTNEQLRALDAFQLTFAPAGAALPETNSQGKPLRPALRIAFAGLGFACPAPQQYVR